MKIEENVNLRQFNTLTLDSIGKYLVELKEIDELSQIPDEIFKLPKLVLGEGSNLLLSSDWDGLVLKVELKGKDIVKEDDNNVWVDVAGGEVWRDLVTWVVERNLGGVENLALIPGTVGAAPVQNIAAYGQNFVDVCDSVDFRFWENAEIVRLSKDECKFGYRDSIFKHELKNQGIVISVRIKLNKQVKLETGYYSMHVKHESLLVELAKTGNSEYGVKDIYEAVCNIRKRQLPDWTKVPTAGSFFKNPLITKSKLEELEKIIPELQFYPADQLSYIQSNDQSFDASEFVKIPAGRILDHLGWRGKKVGHCSTFEKHALILTHDGEATGEEMMNYVKLLQDDVKQKLGIDLEMEVVEV